MYDDGHLIAQVRRGDLRSFEVLYEKYKGQVYRAALAIANDSGAAEDILQDCFLRLHANIDRIDGSTPISPWLHRVTVNLSYNYVAKRKRRAEPGEAVLERLHWAEGSSIDRHVESAAARDEVQEAIDSLSLPHRVVITLFYLSEFSVEEIAYILDCPVGTVKSRLHYARNTLRKRLMGEVGRPGEAAAG